MISKYVSTVGLSLSVLLSAPHSVLADAVTTWNANAGAAAIAACISPVELAKTSGDSTWTPLQPTYAQPDYPSAHAVQGGAAAEVLARVLGTDDIGFEACSMSLPCGSTCTDASPVLHSFSSFSEAANENGLSRVLIGIHFRNAVEEGIRHGRRIAARAVRRFLRPVY